MLSRQHWNGTAKNTIFSPRQFKGKRKKRDKYKVYGELINTYGYNLEPGSKELTALNYYTNEEITIPLDPTQTPGENAQRYFAKYNKQKRTFEALTELIQETADDIQYLESISNALDIALNEADLAQIKEELMQSGYIRRKHTKKKVKLTSKPMHYIPVMVMICTLERTTFKMKNLLFLLPMAMTGGSMQRCSGISRYRQKRRG